jgi:hypothetical protein
MPDIERLVKFLAEAGADTLLVAFIIAIIRGWIVPGYIVTKKDAEITLLRASVDELQKELRVQISVNTQAVTITEKMREVAKQVISETRRR